MNTLDSTATRSLAGIVPAPKPHWVGDGFFVHGYFSVVPDLARRLSPFVLLDYHAPRVYPPTENMRRGVGPHPHRGFETVTIALEGSVAHHDSTGAGGVIGPGDVQWMTAGAGILHKEYHEARFARAGGIMHMLQLWVNIPAKAKMTAPTYQLLASDAMGLARLPDHGGIVRVLAGSYASASGPARTFTPMDILDVRLNAGGSVTLDRDPAWNIAILVMKGSVRIDGGREAKAGDFAVFANDGRATTFAALAPETHCMVLAGEPIDEPIVQYGPFVMNTENEIRDAIADYNAGRFGELAE